MRSQLTQLDLSGEPIAPSDVQLALVQVLGGLKWCIGCAKALLVALLLLSPEVASQLPCLRSDSRDLYRVVACTAHYKGIRGRLPCIVWAR